MVRALLDSAHKSIHMKEIRSRYRKCLSDLRDYFYEQDNTTPEAVHRVRVNLKRVNALIALLRFNKEEPSAKKLRALKSLFKAAGRLRSIQVEFATISAYFRDDTMNPNYLHQLHEMKARRLRQYSRHIESAPRLLVDSMKTLKKSIGQVTKKQIYGYLRCGERSLARRLRRSIFREQELHFIRKDLKKFYLNLKLSGHEREQLEKLLDLLGEWHDRQIAFDHLLKAIYMGRLSAAESEPIRKIKYDLIHDKEDLYEKIVSYYTENMQSAKIGS